VTATPPRADLRTLATHAAHDVDCPEGPNCGDELTTDGRYGRYADAVLAAVLPEHRRMVLGEAAEALQHRADNVPWSDPDIKRGVQYAHSVVVMLARESAAAAPPAGLSATVPAETAPPVPEETDGRRAGGEVRCACDDFGDGECVVHDALTYAEMECERDRLARELYEANCELAVLKSKPLFSTRKVMRVLLKAAGDEVTDQELTLRIDDGLTLAGTVDLVLATLALTEQERLWSRRAYEETKADRDRLAAQVAHYRRVVEAARAWRAQFAKPDDIKWPRRAALVAAVDALPDAGPHQHECACNRNWGGPCGPCVCEEPPRQGVWRLTCGAENIPPNQTYATKGAAEDVMRLHDGACPGTHGVEFVPDAGADQTEDDRGV
jgi:hypothetical protein